MHISFHNPVLVIPTFRGTFRMPINETLGFKKTKGIIFHNQFGIKHAMHWNPHKHYIVITTLDPRIKNPVIFEYHFNEKEFEYYNSAINFMRTLCEIPLSASIYSQYVSKNMISVNFSFNNGELLFINNITGNYKMSYDGNDIFITHMTKNIQYKLETINLYNLYKDSLKRCIDYYNIVVPKRR